MQGLGRTQVTIPITSGSCPPRAGSALQAASMSGHLHTNRSVHNPHSRGREKRSPHTSSSVQLTGGDGSFLCTSHWLKQVMWSCPTTRGWGRILICTCKVAWGCLFRVESEKGIILRCTGREVCPGPEDRPPGSVSKKGW